jgi:hypothetical protein
VDRETAQKLMVALHDLDAPLNAAAAVIETIADEAEKKALRRPLGEIMGLTFEVMLPVIRKYRDLDPDKDTEWYKELQARRAQRSQDRNGDA